MKLINLKKGFTIIEILLALIVLGIGVIGILALFPVGIQSTKESVDDTIAAIYAASIKSAIITGMRNQQTNNRRLVTINHNGLIGGQYQFTPPGLGGRAVYPQIGEGNWPAGGNYMFQLGNPRSDPVIANAIQDILDNFDATESTRQYQFYFEMRCAPTRPLYTVTIHIFRNFVGSNDWPADRTSGNWANMKHPDQVKDFSFMVCGF